jgi:hypothetical protein
VLANRFVGGYLWVIGLLLLLHGIGSLLLRFTGHDDPSLTHGFVHADNVHAAIHIVWGAIMLAFVGRRASDRQCATLALIFGIFYTGLAILGTVVYHPFGLDLGIYENSFHFIVGPTSLLLGGWAIRAQRVGPLPAMGRG